MRYDKDKIISDFNLVPFGSQGWLTNRSMECPFCGKAGKWGIIFNMTGHATFHCWKCPRKTTLFEFLKKLNRLDLTKRTYTVKTNELQMCPKIKGDEYLDSSKWMEDSEEVQTIELKPVQLPLRIKPLEDDEYLNGRGFLPEHYKEFEPSYTNTPLEPKLKNFIIFKMKIDGVCVAWWARSRYSKEWHKRNLEAYKRHEEDLVLRYRNSENNFQDLLGGYNFLEEGVTDTVIIVEGLFDFIGIWNILNLKNVPWLKCCFTFGNNIGKGQIDMLLKKKIKNIILLYDYDTIDESKDTALKMRDIFDNVWVTAIKTPGVDPGNISYNELMEVLGEAKEPLDFYCNKISNKYK